MSALKPATSTQCHYCLNNYSMQTRPFVLNCGDTFCERCVRVMQTSDPAACISCKEMITNSCQINRQLEAAFADMGQLSEAIGQVKAELQLLKKQQEMAEVNGLILLGRMKIRDARNHDNAEAYRDLQDASNYFQDALDNPSVDGVAQADLLFELAQAFLANRHIYVSRAAVNILQKVLAHPNAREEHKKKACEKIDELKRTLPFRVKTDVLS